MIKDGIKYGISYLPEDCMAFEDGYRYGAYRWDLRTGETHITEWFKTKGEISDFVRKHREYGREDYIAAGDKGRYDNGGGLQRENPEAARIGRKFE